METFLKNLAKELRCLIFLLIGIALLVGIVIGSLPVLITKKQGNKGPAPISNTILPKNSEIDTLLNRFVRIAISEQEKFGIPASILLAKAIILTDNGKSDNATKYNNFFNIKCFSSHCKNGHCIKNGTDCYMIYDNAWKGWRANSQLMTSARYQFLQKYGNDYKKWTYGLKLVDDEWESERAIGLIENYELYKFDN